MQLKSLLVALVLIFGTVTAFFLGGYHALVPIRFSAGLLCVSAVCLWAASRVRTKKLVTLAGVTIAVATVDEYLHVSTGVYEYYDRGVPSPISVFGWSLLMVFILMIATMLSKFLPWKNRRKRPGTIPALVILILLPVSAGMQGYLPILRSPVILLYAVMCMLSLFYAYTQPLGWTISLMISGMIVGGAMEFVGSLDGLWSFHFAESLPLFMIVVWALRTWAVHASCFLLDVDFAEEKIRASVMKNVASTR